MSQPGSVLGGSAKYHCKAELCSSMENLSLAQSHAACRQMACSKICPAVTVLFPQKTGLKIRSPDSHFHCSTLLCLTHFIPQVGLWFELTYPSSSPPANVSQQSRRKAYGETKTLQDLTTPGFSLPCTPGVCQPHQVLPPPQSFSLSGCGGS